MRPTWELRVGHVLDELRALESDSVQCVVTSPPYWGLRDYGLPPSRWGDGWEGCLGLEPTPEQFVGHLAEVFSEVRRVLRADGVCWMNMGDCYAGSGKGAQGNEGIACKQRLLMPARAALALQADDWWVRSEVVWSKPNPMPSSVTDRPTDAHEMLYLLTKSARYFYDATAIREDGLTDGRERSSWSDRRARGEPLRRGDPGATGHVTRTATLASRAGRNKRTVWEIPTEPYPGAHFATYPTRLVEPCVLAGTSERGACSECGAPWDRVVERSSQDPQPRRPREGVDTRGGAQAQRAGIPATVTSHTTGWEPTCEHRDAPVRPCVVLDPFCGSGTTGVVALRHGCSFVGIELSESYAHLARERIGQKAPSLFVAEVAS